MFSFRSSAITLVQLSNEDVSFYWYTYPVGRRIDENRFVFFQKVLHLAIARGFARWEELRRSRFFDGNAGRFFGDGYDHLATARYASSENGDSRTGDIRSQVDCVEARADSFVSPPL